MKKITLSILLLGLLFLNSCSTGSSSGTNKLSAEYEKNDLECMKATLERRSQDAQIACGRLVTLEPKYVQSHLNMAKAYKIANNYNAALQSYEKAIALKNDPARSFKQIEINLDEIYYDISNIYFESLYDYDKALEYAELAKQNAKNTKYSSLMDKHIERIQKKKGY